MQLAVGGEEGGERGAFIGMGTMLGPAAMKGLPGYGMLGALLRSHSGRERQMLLSRSFTGFSHEIS